VLSPEVKPAIERKRKLFVNVNKCWLLAFIILVFLVHTKNMEAGLLREPICKYLHLYCGGWRKQAVADGLSTWSLHLLCFQISAFCHQFHSPNQKAWQVQATQETGRICGFKMTRTQSASIMEGI